MYDENQLAYREMVEEHIREHFPVETSTATFACLPCSTDGTQENYIKEEEERSFVLFRLITWEEPPEQRTVRGIVEQEIYFDLPGQPLKEEDQLPSKDRFSQMFQAWVEAVRIVLKEGDLEYVYPADLFRSSFFGVLQLKKARTKEQFLEAFMKKSRLGHLLEPG